MVHVCAVKVDGDELGEWVVRDSVRAAAYVDPMVLVRDASTIARCLTTSRRCAGSDGRQSTILVRVSRVSHRVAVSWMTARDSREDYVVRPLIADVRGAKARWPSPGDTERNRPPQ